MRHHTTRSHLSLLLAGGLVAVSAGAFAQSAQPRSPCDDNSRSDRAQACEVRQATVPMVGSQLSVDASPNGGIPVRGSARQDVQFEAKVIATADTDEQARALAAQVHVLSDGGRIRAEGPAQTERGHWSVSYDLLVPAQAGLDLRSTNGGISIADLQSQITFRTTNGGVKLTNVNGQVRGGTTNGGVNVDLDGSGWYGEGLEVETRNGGVRLRVPDGYSAHLEAGTENGGLRTDFAITVQGQVGRRLSTDIGRGGSPIRLTTTNGGVSIERK